MAVPPGTFTDPPGDPAGIEDAAVRIAQLATDLDGLATSLRTQVVGPDSWRGATAEAARVSAEGTAAAIAKAAAAIQPASPALTAWATALREARTAMAGLRAEHEDELYRFQLQMSRLREQAALAALHPAGPSAARPGYQFGVDPVLAEQTRHAAEESRLRRAADQVRDDLDDAALTCRAALEETRGAFVPGHRQSIDDYLQGVTTELLTQIPVLDQHHDTVEAAVWAVMGAPSALAGGVAGATRLSSLVRFFTKKSPLYATKISYLQELLLRQAGLGAWLESSNAVNQAWLGTSRSANLLSTFATAARGQGVGGLLSAARTTATAGGAARFLGIGGGLAATGASFANVAAQGNPWTAVQEKGTEYLADVAELGFNASFTAMMVAPNPFTVGAVAVTGIAWAGLEIYNHADDIAQLASDVGPMIADTYDAATDVAGDAIDTVADTGKRVVDGAMDKARDIGSALNPFD